MNLILSNLFLQFLNTWWGMLIFIAGIILVWTVISTIFYKVFFKRFYDILLSGIALIVLSPITALVAILVRVKLGSPVVFSQERPLKKGIIKKIHKFRTMTDARDKEGNLLPDSERLTKFGKMLRSTSLDELPQLWDIFIGRLSIVGPRPLLVRYLPLYSEEQSKRHNVRPGLTGLAQVNGRNAISWEKKFEYDVKYVNKVSLFLDIKIIFLTIGKVFKRKGINQGGQATMEYFLGKNSCNKEANSVLILSAGRRVELVKAFLAAEKKQDVIGQVIVADASPYAPALYFANKFYIIPKIESKEYITSIIDICKKESIKLIIPTIDTELILLAENKVIIEKETKAKVMVSDFYYIDICRDKIKTSDFFHKNNFTSPKTLSVEDIKSGNYKYPLFIKPKDGSSSVNAFKVSNQKELDFFIDYIKNPIVQECVTGIEYTIDVFSDFSSNVITIVPRKRMSTRSGEILKGQIDKNRIIINDVQRLMNVFKSIGHVTIQGFLGEDNIFRYIEINPRFGGGAPMSFIAGANSAENLLNLLNGANLSYNEDYRDNIILSRFDDCVEIKI